MLSRIYLRFIVSCALLFSIFAVSIPQIGYAQTSTQTAVSSELQARLAKIEEKVEARRKELGIPGMSLVIVKDGQIIYMKGLGYKDFEKKIAVTPDTQFAIGSATKAFTALSVLMSADEGKLSLDDSPKKYLPYFKINNPDTDAKITVRDLLSHSSGLNRTDLAMITGKLNREELIRVVGEAKPMAGLREKFFYQNIMFAAAGEITAKVQKKTWEKFVPERIFKPLGMTNSNMAIRELEKAKDFSYGYDYNFDTKQTRKLPFRPINDVAPAGSINSSARDMAKWITFVMNGGEFNGKRLVSAKGFDEWTKPQMKIAGKTSYGLGWFLQDWKGSKIVQHGGNIDGFNSMVAMLPEKKLGFVMLTNVSGSPLGNDLMPLIFGGILEEEKLQTTENKMTAAIEKEVGKYRFEAANFDIEVKIDNGKLVAIVPNQPTYILENVSGRKYKLAGAPDGFFMTFTDKDAFLEQPQGNYTLPKAGASVETKTAGDSPAKELVGKYEMPEGKGSIEVKDSDGKITLNIAGQQPYELKQKTDGNFSLSPLPDAYFVKVNKASDGKLEGIAINQPEGEFKFKFLGKTDAPKVSVDEVMAKTVEALGGDANWRKLSSRETKFEMDFENQGVKASGVSYTKAPNMSVADVTMTALGKNIATSFEYFDGTNGGEKISFAPAETYSGQRLEDVKYDNDFYGLVNWKKGLKSAEVSGTAKIAGEDTYVVVIRPEKASEFTLYISQKSFLPLKKTSVIVSSTSSQKLPVTSVYSDYRTVDGVMIPFKTVSESPTMGNVITYIKEVNHNIVIDGEKFKPKKTN